MNHQFQASLYRKVVREMCLLTSLHTVLGVNSTTCPI